MHIAKLYKIEEKEIINILIKPTSENQIQEHGIYNHKVNQSESGLHIKEYTIPMNLLIDEYVTNEKSEKNILEMIII